MNAAMIAGRYRLERRLGIGGMSTVQLAFDETLERQVALKLLAEHLAEDPSFVSRFRREALAAARLVHPNIVQVFDFGLDEPTGQHYIVMEFVEGASCAELLREHGTLPVGEAIDIVGQACRGLDHAHRNGVVHRDVKPGNLLRSTDNVVKLADFGIAKATEQSSITQVGSVLGTAAYLAPEQARGEEAGPEADIYALGVVTYQLLSGRLPYEATSLTELAFKQQREHPLPLDQLNPEVPSAVARAVEHALTLEVPARYGTALAMGEALRAAERGVEPPPVPVAAGAETDATRVAGIAGVEETEATRALPRQRRPQAQPVSPRTPVPPRAEPRRQPAARARRRSGARRFWTLVVVVLLLGGGAIAAVVASSQSGEPRLRTINAPDAHDAIDQLKSLVDDNVR